MAAVEWTLEELLPHRPPMVLIDEVESFDAASKRLTVRVTITPEQIFFFKGQDGVPNWVAIEYMAQASAALAGCWDKHVAPDLPARPGLLLGTRKLELNLAKFEQGRTYHVTAENAFSDADAASFACTITDDAGQVVATASLNAYRPQNLEQFLKEQAKA
ncbi:MAG: hypothetical protein MJ249_07920 [Kiritimatiellae bacterium]|nr:hypothetical protein [Kiritimatiellia bacterium]